MPELPAVDDLNKFDNQSFKEVVSLLFELAPPLEKRLMPQRPFRSYQHLIDEGRHQISLMSLSERQEVLCGHPAIGEKKLKGFSKIEQGRDEPEEVYIKLARLNKEYEDYFSFPFVIFVNGRSKKEISHILENIMRTKEATSSEEELSRALTDLFFIAEDRLKKSSIQSSL